MAVSSGFRLYLFTSSENGKALGKRFSFKNLKTAQMWAVWAVSSFRQIATPIGAETAFLFNPGRESLGLHSALGSAVTGPGPGALVVNDLGGPGSSLGSGAS